MSIQRGLKFGENQRIGIHSSKDSHKIIHKLDSCQIPLHYKNPGEVFVGNNTPAIWCNTAQFHAMATYFYPWISSKWGKVFTNKSLKHFKYCYVTSMTHFSNPKCCEMICTLMFCLDRPLKCWMFRNCMYLTRGSDI